MPTTRVYIVRHGETYENRTGIMQGQMDSKLNEMGVEQAKVVAEALKGVPFEAAYSSDLSRAADTGETILIYHPGIELQKDEALRERHMGELQGQPIIVKNMTKAPAGLEDLHHFSSRLVSWWNRAIIQGECLGPSNHNPRHVLVTSHGGAIGTLVRSLVASGQITDGEGVALWKVPNVSITTMDVDETGSGTLVKFADVSFLDAEIEKALAENVDEKV